MGWGAARSKRIKNLAGRRQSHFPHGHQLGNRHQMPYRGRQNRLETALQSRKKWSAQRQRRRHAHQKRRFAALATTRRHNFRRMSTDLNTGRGTQRNAWRTQAGDERRRIAQRQKRDENPQSRTPESHELPSLDALVSLKSRILSRLSHKKNAQNEAFRSAPVNELKFRAAPRPHKRPTARRRVPLRLAIAKNRALEVGK